MTKEIIAIQEWIDGGMEHTVPDVYFAAAIISLDKRLSALERSAEQQEDYEREQREIE